MFAVCPFSFPLKVCQRWRHVGTCGPLIEQPAISTAGLDSMPVSGRLPARKKGPCYMLPCLVLLSVYVIFRVTTTGPTQICQVGHDLSQVFILTQLRHRVVAKACQNGKDDCEDHIAGKPRIMRRDNTTFKLGKKKGTQSNKVETQRKAKNRKSKTAKKAQQRGLHF